jgi:ankyrin repeat protein
MGCGLEWLKQEQWPPSQDKRCADALDQANIAEFKAAVAAGANLHRPGMCPIGRSVTAGSASILDLVLQHGCTIPEEFECWGNLDRWFYPLQDAVERNHFEAIAKLRGQPGLLEALNDCTSGDHFTLSPLALAAGQNNATLVSLLLDLGANPDAHNEDVSGETALAEAIMQDHYEVVKMLISAGANPDIPGWMWISPRDRSKKSSPAIRDLIATIPFKPTNHHRYTRDRFPD